MKANRWKKILLVLAVFALSLSTMSACAKSSGTLELEAKEEIEDKSVEYIIQLSNSMFGQQLAGISYDEFQMYLMQNGRYISGLFDQSLLKRWKDFDEAHGRIVEAECTEAEATEEGYVSHVVWTAEDGQMMRLNVTFDKAGVPVTSTLEKYADDAGKTLGDKLAEAGTNTLIGLAVVFSVLILLSLVISAFGLIGNAGKKKEVQAKAAAETQAVAAPAKAVEPVSKDENDPQLVAVIAAAIAAAEGTSTDAFVVRSIRRANKRRAA